jgi:hypothetical protein
MDISKSIGHKPLGNVESTIGILYIFSLTLGHQIQLYKDLNCPIDKCDPELFARLLAVYVCYPETVLVEGEQRPKSTALTRADVENLTADDIENIACIYVEGNDYLYRERLTKTTQTEKGTVLTSEKGDITYPKENGESCTKYLHRLFIIQEKKMTEQFKKFAEPFGHFSDQLKRSIGESLAVGEALKKSFSAIPNVTVRPIERVMPSIDFAEIERNIEHQRLKPFKELSERLDRLIETSEQSSEFQIETHKVQTAISEELKVSGDSAAHFSKQNIALSKLVILLTILGMVISLYIYVSNQNDSSNKDKFIAHQATEITSLLKDINGKLAESHNSLPSTKQEQLSTAAYKKLEKTIKTQQQLIIDLQKQRENQTTKLRLLEDKLTTIEKNIEKNN